MANHHSPYRPDDVLQKFAAARTKAFAEAGRAAGLSRASTDQQKIAVILVDYQYDFVDPAGSLPVPGAREDIQRFLHWFYDNAQRITTIYASMDTHLPRHIFFSSWWKDRKGNFAPEYQQITASDVENGVWIPQYYPDWSRQYVQTLRDHAQKILMIWPYHCMEGTQGHALAPAISEAITWHSAARQTQPNFIVKGRTERTEYYGIFGAEVTDPTDPDSYMNEQLLDGIWSHDRVYVAGEAKSHCVLETERQLLKQPAHIQKLYFLRDCTSSIRTPHDFEQETEAALQRMQADGVHMVKSHDAIK